MSERVPLGTVPSVELHLDGSEILFGRSSNSSQYQLSANRLISRIHVKASYHTFDDEHEHGQVRIECVGWNGLKVHCLGMAHMLGKGDIFLSDKPQAEIMLDVQDARMLLRWPAQTRKGSLSGGSDATLEDPQSPERTRTPTQDDYGSSPPQLQAHLHSPVSPSPSRLAGISASSTFLGLPSINVQPAVQVYEDSTNLTNPTKSGSAKPDASPTQPPGQALSSSSLSSLEDVSDRDEENDPIVHSFGPFGDNLLPRMASFQAVSPERRRDTGLAPGSPKQTQPRPMANPRRRESSKHASNLSPIRNHVINQLAFSRLHSLPLSTILNNLPPTLKDGKMSYANVEQQSEAGSSYLSTHVFVNADLKQLLYDTPCVGEIVREGKDAAGKALEDEFYYLPELDDDQMRKSAVENSLGKPGLRAVRKQHKVGYCFRPALSTIVPLSLLVFPFQSIVLLTAR